MCKSITIGTKQFATKEDLKTFTKEILYKYSYNQVIPSPDADFLKDLVANHPEAEMKIGCGIDFFTIKPNMTSRVFYLTRTDGTSTDWSYLSCVTPPSRLTIVKKAGRNTVRDQVIDFKRRNFKPGMICPVSGRSIDTSPLAHVDHMSPTFDEIVTSFIKERDLDIAQIELEGMQDNAIQKTWAGVLGEEFKSYHASRAQFQIVHEYANLSLLDSKKNQPNRFAWQNSRI